MAGGELLLFRKCPQEKIFFSPPFFPVLPAGLQLFYVVVVTGRFIRLEISTNQLSFRASCHICQAVTPAARECLRGCSRGQPLRKEMSSNRAEMELTSLVFLFFLLFPSAPVELALIFLEVEQRKTLNDMLAI